jgi:hypothetical protein
VFVAKHSASSPLVHLRKTILKGRLLAIPPKLLHGFVKVVIDSFEAVKRLPPVLTTCFVDTVGTRVVLAERVNHEIIEPISSHLQLHSSPYLSVLIIAGDLEKYGSA